VDRAVHPTLLERIAAGEPGAVEACMERYRALVWSLARRHLQQHADAEDAVQDIFVAVWRSAARFDPAVASEATYISMIARRRLIDRQRRRARAVAVQSLVEDPVVERQDHQDHVDAAEGASRARDALARLRADQRQVLELSLLEGMSQSQIARTVDLPLGTVKTHARRGLLRLREMLGANSAATITGDAR
jgi:RNA polymerase sigma factor (sigma-70 family)